eukprot:scaffold161490_cov33-Prasinocladus_malaysianus.AAC.2
MLLPKHTSRESCESVAAVAMHVWLSPQARRAGSPLAASKDPSLTAREESPPRASNSEIEPTPSCPCSFAPLRAHKPDIIECQSESRPTVA